MLQVRARPTYHADRSNLSTTTGGAGQSPLQEDVPGGSRPLYGPTLHAPGGTSAEPTLQKPPRSDGEAIAKFGEEGEAGEAGEDRPATR